MNHRSQQLLGNSIKSAIYLATVAVAISIFPNCPTANANDWTRWRGPDATGISTETGWQSQWPAEGPKQLWKTSVGTGFSSMTISKGKLYTMGHDGKKTETVYCLDSETGKPIWTKTYTTMLDPNMYEGGPNATPTVDGDRVYTVSKRGEIFCLDATKGEVIWTKDLTKDWGDDAPMWGFAGSPMVEGDLVILNAGESGIALKKSTGELAWKSNGKKPGYATALPVVWKGEPTIFMMAARAIVALKPNDGKVLWNYPWKTQYDINVADPIYSEGKVFLSSGYDHGCALVDVSGSEPKLVWENKNLRNHFSSSVLWKGFVYGVDDGNSSHDFKCVSWETGEVKWSKTFGRGSLIIADGKIIALNEHGELYVIEPSAEAFKPISHAQVLGGKCWTSPVLANGRIYCRNAGGDLICLDVSGK